MWEISIGISGFILAATFVLIILKINPINGSRLAQPLSLAFVGFFISAMAMFFPICYENYQDEFGGLIITLLAAIHSTIKLFVVDSDFNMVSDAVNSMSRGLRNLYEIQGAVLITFTPILTFGVVLSFFKNAMSYQKYLLHYFRDAYIFSEANEKSLALAESIREKNKKCLLIFNDMFESEEENSYELRGRVQQIGGLCFKKDVVTIDYRFHSRKRLLYFFVIGEQESENIEQTLRLAEKYHDYDNVRIDVFAKSKEAELLLKTKDKGKIKMIRRINDVQSLIFRILYETGENIFKHCVEKNGEKVISAVVIGMGQHGFEMARGLTWFCQMIGYRFELDIFDKDKSAKEQFEMLCPDLISPKYNGVRVDGEPDYTIRIHSGIDVNTASFKRKLAQITNPSYVFIALGSDSLNVQTSMEVRAFYALNKFEPRIQSVLYNSSEREALYQAKYNDSSRTAAYRIEFVGDIKSSYSEAVIMGSEIERKALTRHLEWGSEESFWAYEYNYRSSIASAIHYKMKIVCQIPYADVVPEKRPDKERDALRKLEHCRWSAYVRSEGYTFGEVRNDLAKKHPCLVPYEQLSDADKAKDDV